MAYGVTSALPDPVNSQICTNRFGTMGYTFEQLGCPWPVDKDTYKYVSFDTEAFRIAGTENTFRAAGAPANEVLHQGMTWAENSIQSHALSDFIADEVLANAETPALRQKIIEGLNGTLQEKLMQRAELTFQSLITDTGTIANTSPVIKWGAATAIIVKDVETAAAAMQLSCGLMPNWGIMPISVAIAVSNSPDYLDRTKYTSNQFQGVAQSFPYVVPFAGINWIVPGVRQNTSATTTPAIARIWGASDTVVLLHIPENAASDPYALCPLRTFTGGATASGLAFESFNWRDTNPTAKTEYWALEWRYRMQLLVPEAAYLLTGTLA